MVHFHNVAARAAVLVVTSSMLVAGCSSSSESPALTEEDNVVSESDSIATTSQPEADPITSDGSMVGANDLVEETSIDTQSMSDASENVNETDNTDAVSPDLTIQDRTQVNFNIMVPAFQSDALKLRLVWGEIDIDAEWVGDEFWSASADLPTDTEHTLIVTFSDSNGDIELARSTQEYRTGVNDAETFVVGVDQFDASLFDDDGDGVNNLDELIAGSDPAVDEDSLLLVRDAYTLNSRSLISVSRNLESFLTEERPQSATTTFSPISSQTLFTNVNIDLNGNGIVVDNFEGFYGCGGIEISGTRTVSENAIIWEVIRSDEECDPFQMVNVINTVAVVDENTRTYAEEIEGSRTGTFTYRWESSANLTARVIDGTSQCEPVSGTISYDERFRINDAYHVQHTVSKEVDDLYWRVVESRQITFSDGVNVDEEVDTIEEYFVRELRAYQAELGEPLFICDFVDF